MLFKKVAVGLSGGIDSAVSALLLRNKGFDVIGTFMRNWDEPDDSNSCSVLEDIEDAKWVCSRLQIPFKEVGFVKEFWTYVFQDLIANYNVGMTPNPDIQCNEFIKFGCFFNYCMENLKVDAIATGHYVQSSYGPFLENYDLAKPANLLCSVDNKKDQSFFLSRISQAALQRSMFPVGTMTKQEVKQIGLENEFDRILKRKESMGICFIGRKKFQSFISEYVMDKPGKFLDVDTGEMVGVHSGIHHWTIGQRCFDNYFVVDNDEKETIFVAKGREHPALFCRSLILTDLHWIVQEPEELRRNRMLNCKVKYMHSKPMQDCNLIDIRENNMVLLNSEKPLYAVAPGQFAVFYDNGECLGCARILSKGPSDVFLSSEVPPSDSNEKEAIHS